MMGPDDLGRLIEEHAAALTLYARQWCAAPEDVVQEAFIKLLGQRPPPVNSAAWLYRVVRNTAIGVQRAQRRRRQHEAASAQEHAAWFVATEESALDVDAVTRALQTLPDDEREVITLHLWGRLTFGQIADVAGCSSSTAHRWYLEGLARLRERFTVPCTRT